MALTNQQVEESYRFHREGFEEQLARSIAGGKPRGQRPLWWWRFAEEAAPYREAPGSSERADDYTVADTVPEPSIRAGIKRRRVAELGRLRFLAERGLLSDAEVELIIAGGDTAAVMRKGVGLPTMYEHQARVVREALAARRKPGSGRGRADG